MLISRGGRCTHNIDNLQSDSREQLPQSIPPAVGTEHGSADLSRCDLGHVCQDTVLAQALTEAHEELANEPVDPGLGYHLDDEALPVSHLALPRV